ncbi:MAG: hypothetical protein BroJett011_67390 [Chloroflexota bacterium]|nr:MAG: hypothetical protein BroJett011_67390 [Chloroflexota bacterium]
MLSKVFITPTTLQHLQKALAQRGLSGVTGTNSTSGQWRYKLRAVCKEDEGRKGDLFG